MPRPEPLAGRTAVDHRCRVRDRPRARAAAVRGRLPGRDRRRRRERAEETAASLPGPVLRRVLDVRDAADQTALRRTRCGRGQPAPLGAVFNNAGVAICSTVLDAVAGGRRLAARHQLPRRGQRDAGVPADRWSTQDHGAIVNTSSVYGLVGVPYQSAYCAAKFAVRGFTEALRQELRGTGVRAVDRAPGRGQDQHRPQRAVPRGPRGPRAHPRSRWRPSSTRSP